MSGDIHATKGGSNFNFANVALFSVSALTPGFATLANGGVVSGAFALSATGLGSIAKTLGITAPLPTQNVGTLTFTSTSAVPEPSVELLSLVGVGGVLFFLARRRRDRA